jgi:hypothetical protein
MNLKTEIVALAVRTLAEKTNLVRKPDAFEELINTIFTGKSFDQRVAEDVIGTTDELASIAKRIRTRHQVKKIRNV